MGGCGTAIFDNSLENVCSQYDVKSEDIRIRLVFN